MKFIKFYAFVLYAIVLNAPAFAQGDDCGNALLISNVVKYCSNPGQFSNAGSSASALLGVSSCWSANAAADVWFRFKAIGTDAQISVAGGGSQGTIKKPQLALYSGSCTLNSINVTELRCDSSKFKTPDVTTLYKGSLVPGQTYTLRVSTTGANRGSFTLCISNFTPTVNPGADCDGVVKLCDKTDVNVPGLSGGGKNNKEIETGSCFKGGSGLESNSSWYKWICDKPGTLTFDIVPVDPSNDLDFILYELTGAATNPCGARTILRCTATACVRGNNGLNMTETDVSEPINCPSSYNGYLKYIDMVAGKTYALMVNNFSAASGFSIKFGGSGTFLGPKAVITGANGSNCLGDSAIVKGDSSKNYDALLWSFNPGKPVSATTVGPHKVTYGAPGNYTIYLKASDATCASGNSLDSFKVTVNAPPVLDVSSALVTKTNCITPTGSITQITATGAPVLTYEWFKPPFTSISTSTTTADLKDVPAGFYFLVVKDGNGCKDSSMSYEIEDFGAPASPGVLNNIPYCKGDALQPITANGTGGTYTWYDDINLTDTLHVGPVYTPTNVVTDTIYLTETTMGCTSRADTVIVIIHALPTADAGPALHIDCSSPIATIKGVAGNGTALAYSWLPLNGIVSGANTLAPQVNVATTYTLTVKDTVTGCLVKDSVLIIKDPVPVSSFTSSVITGEAALTVAFTNTSQQANTFEWIFGDNSTSSEANPTHVFENPKLYTVLLIASDTMACPDTSSVLIRVYEKFTYTIPNIFTPNGDGKNDLFTINSSGIEAIEGEIYDRWGLKIFSWNKKNDGWDGRTLSGSKANDGNYFYIIKIKPQDGKETVIESGQLILQR